MSTLFDNPLHLVLLVVVIVLLFGATKLGDVGGALGKSIREFKKEAGNHNRPHPVPIVTPPTAGYVPPAPRSYGHQPDQTTPSTLADYVAGELVRCPDTVPADYRPSLPPQTLPADGTRPPDYFGR